MKRVFECMTRRTLIGLVALLIVFPMQTLRAQDLLFDPFDNQSLENWQWWTWGTGFSQVSEGLATFTITSESSSENYSDAEITDYNIHTWLHVSMEMRLRCSHDNVTGGEGSIGWGLWNGIDDIVWFSSISPESYPPFTGFKAWVMKDNVPQTIDLSAYDITQWHTYRLDWHPQHVSFFIDDALVGSLSNPPDNPLYVVIWIDNTLLTCTEYPNCTKGHLDLEQDQFIELDYVRISQTGNSYPAAANAEASTYGGQSVTASGSFNALTLLLVPVGAVILLRISRRKRSGRRLSARP